jgi:peptidyl-prolyl cis-trans isomerase A (cyclophilin A)
MRRILCTVFVLLGCLAVPARGGTLAQFRTQFGTIDVELYDQDKPVTVQNFIRYVQGGFYVNMFAHRGVANFVIQGGVYYATNLSTAPYFTNYNAVNLFPPITNEFGVGPFYSNKYGTIAMAKTANPNSATSQFFFNLVDNPGLDNPANSGGFTVFGRVVGGTNVLNKLNAGASNPAINIYSLTFSKPSPDTNLVSFSELPVVSTATFSPFRLSDLIFFDITLLNVQVTNQNGAVKISWDSVSGKTNFVEYTTGFPPAWQALTNFVGTGSATNVTDTAVGSGRRFYRVRVAY